MHDQHARRRPRGLSLVEVAIVAAMLAVIAGAITLGLLRSVADARLQRAVRELGTLERGVASWVQRTGAASYSTLTSIQILTQSGAVPARFAQSGINPWNGDYNVMGEGEVFSVIVGQVPDAATCQQLQQIFSPRATTVCPENTPGHYPGDATIVFGPGDTTSLPPGANKNLTVTVTPSSGGTVTGSIQCGAGGTSCSLESPFGSVFVLTATPEAGFVFDGWGSGSCDQTLPGNRCRIVLTSNRTVTATFSPSGGGGGGSGGGGGGGDGGSGGGDGGGTPHDLIVYPDFFAHITGYARSAKVIDCRGDLWPDPGPTCTASILAGDQIDLYLTTTDPEFEFWQWVIDGNTDSPVTNNPMNLVMPNQDITVDGLTLWTGASAPVTLTVSVSPPGGSVVSTNPPGLNCPPACEITVPWGTPVTLLATGPGPLRWVGGLCHGTDTNPCTTTVYGTEAVRAFFGPVYVPPYQVLVALMNMAGPGQINASAHIYVNGVRIAGCRDDAYDSVSTWCRHEVMPGDQITVVIVPDDGFHFIEWSEENGSLCAGSGSPTCSFTMPFITDPYDNRYRVFWAEYGPN